MITAIISEGEDMTAGEPSDELLTICARMTKGGYAPVELSTCDLGRRIIYSLRFHSTVTGESDIHAQGENDIIVIAKSCLAEAHRRYREALLLRSRDAS